MLNALLQIKRNDIQSVLRIRHGAKMYGEWSPEDEEVAITLQDNPDDLIDAFVEQDKMLEKALPRMSAEAREEKMAPKDSKPIGAGTKTMGAGGQVRYNYPGEQGGDKKPGVPGKFDQPTKGNAPKEADQQPVLPEEREAPGEGDPRTDIPPPEPDSNPIQPPNETQQQDGPKHTVNVAELCTALGLSREKLQQIVQRFAAGPEPKLGRKGFVTFMQTHARDFIEEHQLDGDYFGLVFDVITGKIPEGQQQPKQPPPTAQGK